MVIGKKKVMSNLCDTAGEEKYRALAPLYYRDANGAMIVFDLTKKETLNKVDQWLAEVQSMVNSDNFRFIIVGNKMDLEGQIDLKESDIKLIADKYQVEYYLVSAKTGENIDFAYQMLIEKIDESISNERSISKKRSLKVDPTKSIKLKKPIKSSQDKKNCC